MSTTYYDRIVVENVVDISGFAPEDEHPKGVVKWSGASIPAVGDRVHVKINDLGYGTVSGYFVEPAPDDGYLGVKVMLENRPAWHVKQNPDRPFCLVFGAEIEAAK